MSFVKAESEALTQVELSERLNQYESALKKAKLCLLDGNLVSLEEFNRRNREQRARAFDMNQYEQQSIALKIVYLGWRFQGFAAQENCDNTVEVRKGLWFRSLLGIRTWLMLATIGALVQRVRTDPFNCKSCVGLLLTLW